ncbi:hypothetical protein EKH77_30510 [Streptomyces luteoverticillatus]|uniref:Uncharacterized protein n=1 Tax=Streptomyces luteoverticillatus TaxID=66425 RepID=A0A3Q9G423_STRLT|nr:hypothetical protein EKH77_30510 [Streptomyces luteoverticillatus]
MRTRFAVVSLALAASLGGIALAPTADAAHHQSAPLSVARLVKAPGFNAAGTWSIYQSNVLIATLNVTQDAQGNLTGTASKSGSSATGTIDQGFVDGNYIYFVIPWSDGTKGRYIGSLGADRHLSGVSTDLAHPTSQATWNTTQAF